MNNYKFISATSKFAIERKFEEKIEGNWGVLCKIGQNLYNDSMSIPLVVLRGKWEISAEGGFTYHCEWNIITAKTSANRQQLVMSVEGARSTTSRSSTLQRLYRSIHVV